MKQSGKQLADMAKCHSSEAFFGCADPLESVIFPVIPEIRKLHDGGSPDVDP
jgi:hypothetical protein